MVERKDGEVTIRSGVIPCAYVDDIVNYPEKIDTMSKLFAYACKKYGERDALGTRELLGEEEVEGPDGKPLTKVKQGPDYSWWKYSQVKELVDQFGKVSESERKCRLTSFLAGHP